MEKVNAQPSVQDLLGGFTNEKKSSSSGKKVYPILPDDEGFIADCVDERIRLAAEKKTIEGRLKKLDGALKDRAIDHCFRHNENSDKPESTIEANGRDGSVKISMTDRYFPITQDSEGKGQARLDAVKKIVGGHSYAQNVTESFSVNIEGTSIPTEQQPEFLQALAQVCQQFGVTPDAKRSASLAKSFHLSRHLTLTPEENRAFHEQWPCTVSLR